MRIPRKRAEAILQGNLVSFTDIAFSVVLFFMVAATFAKSNAMKVELPGSQAGAVDQTQQTITVQADAGSIVLDGASVALPELSAAIGAKLVGRTRPEEKVVVLLTAEDISFQRNVELMHAIRSAGGEVAIMYEETAK
jgi:biopolymer transport protein ExbD